MSCLARAEGLVNMITVKLCVQQFLTLKWTDDPFWWNLSRFFSDSAGIHILLLSVLSTLMCWCFFFFFWLGTSYWLIIFKWCVNFLWNFSRIQVHVIFFIRKSWGFFHTNRIWTCPRNLMVKGLEWGTVVQRVRTPVALLSSLSDKYT